MTFEATPRTAAVVTAVKEKMRVRIVFAVLAVTFAWILPIHVSAQNFDVMVAPLVRDKRYGAPTMVELKDGSILLAYNDWTMPGENSDFSPAYIAARLSRDGGRSWGRPFTLHENTSELGRMGPPTLLRLQSGAIAFFYAELISHSDFRFFFRRSTDEAKTWSQPVQITKEKNYYVMNNHRVVQLKSGRLVAPFSFVPDVSRRLEFSWTVVCYYSDDEGRTWQAARSLVRMPKFPTGAQEPGLVELKDGSLMMIIRNQQERVYKSYSRDGGDTWSEPEPIEQLIAPVSPATIMRVPSTGDLAIVWNYSPKVRTPLAIAVSSDEGKSWGKVKFLERGYFSYAYTAFLFLRNPDRLLLCYWVDDTTDRPSRGIGLRVRGMTVDWLYDHTEEN
ncbi:MAG TPA: sialidase family protein [Pyrinomonadaceae bacterium]|nr:sialidase family protein [Pyrinomonadaceae bacterium]